MANEISFKNFEGYLMHEKNAHDIVFLLFKKS